MVSEAGVNEASAREAGVVIEAGVVSEAVW